MTIDLKNVAVKVERQRSHDCIISIGRLNDVEKNELLGMFPTAIDSLRSRPTLPFASPMFQVTITVNLPIIPNFKNCDGDMCNLSFFKICDGDMCNLSFMDRMIVSQTKLADTDLLYYPNWFDSDSDDSETFNDENNSKEENKMTIELNNVAIKVQRQGKHECIISIGRLNDFEKNSLLNMFPLAIEGLQCKNPIHYTPMFQVTITVNLPNIPDFKICDSDACCLTITDHVITRIFQSKLTDSLCLANWFDPNSDSDSDAKVKCTRLTFVAVKVDNKRGKHKYIRIGRINESEKTRLEQILPANMLNFKSRTIINATRPDNAVCYYEIDLPASAMGVVDSNNCDIIISCYDKKPDSIYVTNQRCSNDAFLSPWFLSIAQRLSPPRVSIAEKVYETTQQMISQTKKEETNMTTTTLEKCIINDNATIMFWSDGTKTVTKTTPGDVFDPEIGIAMGIAKRLFGSKHKFDKYVNAVVSDMYKRNATAFTEKELADALAENEKIITKAKAKHNAEKAAYITAKNDPNHEGKLPELHSLKGDHSYRFAKIRKDILLAEIEKRKAKKAEKAKAKVKAKKKSDKK